MIHCVLETVLSLPLLPAHSLTTSLSHTLVTKSIFGLSLLLPISKHKDKINSSEFNNEAVYVFEYMG